MAIRERATRTRDLIVWIVVFVFVVKLALILSFKGQVRHSDLGLAIPTTTSWTLEIMHDNKNASQERKTLCRHPRLGAGHSIFVKRERAPLFQPLKHDFSCLFVGQNVKGVQSCHITQTNIEI